MGCPCLGEISLHLCELNLSRRHLPTQPANATARRPDLQFIALAKEIPVIGHNLRHGRDVESV
jgi:hypothetical protein